jgi:hypothetical protein
MAKLRRIGFIAGYGLSHWASPADPLATGTPFSSTPSCATAQAMIGQASTTRTRTDPSGSVTYQTRSVVIDSTG